MAVGFYTSKTGGTRGLVDTLRNGTWTPASVPLPANGSSPWLNAVSCATTISCVAVGYYTSGTRGSQALIETLSHQSWRAAAAPLPKGAIRKYGVFLQAVTCPATGACLAVGYYDADSKTSTSYGFIDTLANGKWTAAMAPSGKPGRGGKGPALWAVGCATTSDCVAVAEHAIESTVRIGASAAAKANPASAPSTATSPTLSPGPITPGHDTPQDAVDGLIQAELAGDWPQACSYYPPSVQATCDQQAPQLPAFTGNATVGGATTSGSEALVEVTGSMCSGNIGCNSNSEPSAGMPNDQVTFAQAYDQVMSNSSSSLSPVPCIQQNGQWYVNAQP